MTNDLEAFSAKLRAMRAEVESPELRYRLREMDRRLTPQPRRGRAGGHVWCERWQPALLRKRHA